MLKTRSSIALTLGAVISITAATQGLTQEVGRTVILRDASAQDLYAAGGDVQLLAPVTGDAVAAGRSVVIAGDVSEDLIAAGRSVTVSGDIGDDLRIAGRRVTLAGKVAGHTVAAGRRVYLESDSEIDDFAWVAGGRVEIAGRIHGDLKAAGRRLTLSGHVDGNAELAGRRIRIDDGAVIKGNLTWRGREAPEISEGAIIEGEIIEGEPLRRGHRRRGGILRSLFIVVSMIVTTGILFSLFRPACEACATTVRTRPWATLLTGLAVLATTPVVAALLFATGIGALLGLIVVADYLLALLLAGVSGIAVIAQLGLRRFRPEQSATLWVVWGAITVVTVALGVLYVVRPVGILVSTIVMLLGLGAIGLYSWDAVRKLRTA